MKEDRKELLDLLTEMNHYNAGDALEKVNKKLGMRGRRRWLKTFQKIAAILLIPLLVGTVAYVASSRKNASSERMAWHTVQTLPGQKSILDLPDGSRVWLNSETSLSYPLAFNKKYREIRMSGEAYFDVKHNESKPFIVDMGELQVKVLGTEFNVANYEDENQSQVFLESGSIQLMERMNRQERILYKMKPGERAVYNKQKEELLIGKGHTEVCMAWLDGKLVFRDEPMDVVIKRLNRWFNIEIETEDSGIAAYTYTATFQHETLEQILELIKISAPIDYEVFQRQGDENNVFTKIRIKLYSVENR